ncbi:major facilitator superfamily domain-containing protein [Zychaea mexicana]|uniref:major facilitator superfamily domain-containing protein n=1 Tax=Zychaea mexicana TaxID=64656 RepID=UPI0022FDD92E|nr:major facilitator superfamily domain-containing protein [Zychaea mexicana]KAI9494357.1 major facilitator superfamily domain-containing protein [Zychaea mexicana]
MSLEPSHSIDGDTSTPATLEAADSSSVAPHMTQQQRDDSAFALAPAAHDAEVDDEDDFLYQDSDLMLQSENNTQYLKGVVHIKGPNSMCKIVFLTICLAGLQFTWTVEMAYGTPYLLSLGLTKSVMSLVWIAGPLSGLLMQPIVGVVSDRCTSKFGRRRPFIVLGSVIVVISLLIIGWTREITALFTGGTQDGDTFKHLSIGIAIAAIYILDFSINCVQASCRAILVDCLPPSQQEDGTAWAGRMVGIGNVAGYFMGYADLVKAFPFLGNTQLKVLCVIAAFVLVLSDIITCSTVTEKVLTKGPKKKKNSWSAPFKALTDITGNIWNLPKPIRRICNVQFFAWIGWFPFLFYTTTWVAEIYDQAALQNGGGANQDDSLGQATRAGSFAFLVYSLVSLAASFVLPWIVSPSYGVDETTTQTFRFKIRGKYYSITPSRYLKISFLTLPRAWTLGHIVFLLSMLATVFVSNVVGASIVIGICGISWALTMWAPFSLLGEYISEMEHGEAQGGRRRPSLDAENRVGMNRHAMSSRLSLAAGGAGLGTEGGLYQLVEQFDDDDDSVTGPRETNGGIEMHDRQQPVDNGQQQLTSVPTKRPSMEFETGSSSMIMTPLEHDNDDINRRSSESSNRGLLQQEQREQEDGSNRNGNGPRRRSSVTTALDATTPSAGVLLGIHNMYIVAPQFLVTFFASIMFHFLEKNASEGEEASPDAIGVVLRFGALMAGVAAFLSARIGRPYK